MKNIFILILSLFAVSVFGQNLTLGNQAFELKNVTGSIVDFQGFKEAISTTNR